MNLLRNNYKYNGKSILELTELQKRMKKQIETKIKQNKYKFEFVPCCICNNKKFNSLSKKDRYGLYTPIVVCRICGLIQTNPRMNQDSYYDFYKYEYRKLYTNIAKPSDFFFFDLYKKGKEIYSYLIKNNLLKKSPANSYVLEIGCSSGGILKFFKDNGFNIKGIDVDEEYIQFGKNNYNLDLEVGILKDIKKNFTPDIIIYSHVLEHILSINEEIILIKNLLSDEGVLYIELPGVKNLKNSYNANFLRYLQNAHTYHFSLTSLTNLLKLNGFQLIVGDEFIKSVFKKNKLDESKVVIKNDFKDVMNFLNKLENLRIFYYIRKNLRDIIQAFKNLNFKQIKIIIFNRIKGIIKKLL